MRQKKMTKDRAENIIARLEVFARLERKACDEIAWIALAFSCSRAQAEKQILEAKKVMGVSTL